MAVFFLPLSNFLTMSALKIVRTLLVSRHHRSTPAITSTSARPSSNIVATVWSGDKPFERDIRINFFSLKSSEEIATLQTVLEVLKQLLPKDRPIEFNEYTHQIRIVVPDVMIKSIATQLDLRGIYINWRRLDGR